MMKKICLLLVLILMTASVLGLPASAEGLLSCSLTSAEKLLFETDNCTISAQAEFSLDGVRFKSASLQMQLSQNASCQKLVLLTPADNGSDRESGYTVYRENLDGYAEITVLETLKPNTYQQSYTVLDESPSLMHRSAELSSLLSVGHAALDAMEETLAGKMMFTCYEDGGEGLSFSVTEEQLPEICNTAVTLMAKYAGEHFFMMDYDAIEQNEYCRFDDYGTLTGALLQCLDEVWLSSCEVSVTTNREGVLCEADAGAIFGIACRDGSEHALEVSFQLKADQFGTTNPEIFDAESSGIVPFEHNQAAAAQAGNSSGTITAEEALERAKQAARSTMIIPGTVLSEQWSCTEEHSLFSVTGILSDGVQTYELLITVDASGEIHSIEDLAADWRHAPAAESDESELSYRQELSQRLESFAEEINPGSTAAYALAHPDHGGSDGIYYGCFYGTLSTLANRYLVFYTAREEQYDRRTLFVMEVLPQERIVYFDCYTAPEEGGNG